MGIVANYLRVSEAELALYQAKSILLEEQIKNIELDDANFLDIDSAWDGIIFLLTGHGITQAKGDLLHAIVSNQYVDEYQDLGYGPAHYIDASEVKELHAQIVRFDETEIENRFDVARMKELGVYPENWDEKGAFEYLKDYLLKLVDFFGLASANNQAIIGVMKKNRRQPNPNQQQLRINAESHWWVPINVLSIYAIFKCFIYFAHFFTTL